VLCRPWEESYFANSAAKSDGSHVTCRAAPRRAGGFGQKKKPGQRGPGRGVSHNCDGIRNAQGSRVPDRCSTPGGRAATFHGGDVKEGTTYCPANVRRMMPRDKRNRHNRHNI